jgi:hypothetical protein
VGAWLRLADLHHTLFLDDQVALLQLGQAALKDGGLPVTGIRSSIGTLNAPFSIYLYLPFAAAGSPLGAAWMIALANLVALLMTYVVVDRAFGRLAAGATLALYATSAWAVFYSSYFWQQTAVAPFLLVYLLTLYAGVVQKRKRWLVPHLIVLGLLSQLHPIMAYLLPTTLVGLALLWPRIPWKSLVIGLLCIGLLYVPTLLWELVSNWADTRVLLRHFFATSSTYDLLGLDQLLAVLRFQGMLPFGVSAAWLGWLMNGAYVLALGWLGWWVGAPLLRALQAMRRDGAVALWQVREAAEWRGALLLFIWQAAPLLLLIHRTQGYCQCYMVLFFPAPYITLGVCFAWVVRRGKLLEAISTASVRLARRPPASIALSLQGALPGILWRGALVCSLVVLLGLQALASSHLMVAYRGLDTEEASLSAGQHEAYAIGAQHTIVASSLFLQSAFAYLAEHEPGAVEVQSAESCLALPAAAALPTVVVTAFDQKESAVDKVLAALPAATLLRTLPVRDLPPDHLYRVDGSTLHLAGEQTLSQPVVADQHLALEGMVALPGPQRLVVLRWRVLQTYQEPTGTGAEPLSLLFSVQPMTGTSDASGAASTALCTPGHLQVGETLLTWFSLPGSGAALPDSVVLAALSVRTVAAQRVEPVIGPLRLVSGAITRRISQPLPLSCLSGQPFQLSCPLVLPTSPQIFIPIHRCLGDASARLLLAESAPGQFACVVWGREDTRPGAANAPYIFSAFLCQSLW